MFPLQTNFVRSFSVTVLLLSFTANLARAANFDTTAPRPNIIVIMADDNSQ